MRKNPLEWSVFGLGLLLLVALVAYLGVQMATSRGGEAAFRVRLGEAAPIGGGYRTRVTVENVGDATTRAVKVQVDDVEIDLDYVPRHSTREGFVVTPKPPREGRVVSWQAP